MLTTLVGSVSSTTESEKLLSLLQSNFGVKLGHAENAGSVVFSPVPLVDVHLGGLAGLASGREPFRSGELADDAVQRHLRDLGQPRDREQGACSGSAFTC